MKDSIFIREELIKEATLFIKTCYEELKRSEADQEQRIIEISKEIQMTGTYTHLLIELEYGARAAWRNSNRCIGRLFWESLHIFDQRELNSEKAVADALIHHIAFATNEGKIRPAITIFAPAAYDEEKQYTSKVRIWNHQLLRYAGYETEAGVIGDPSSVAFTKECVKLGWSGEGTDYDVLPLVIQLGDQTPKLFEIPKEIVKEVEITHDEYPKLEELRMKWYAVPIVSDMRLTIGGIHYTAAPFNGWYMGTEIGSRNLADTSRYNMLGKVAEAIGLAQGHASSLWKDRALVELNAAVLDSFKKSGVTIVDHHTAAAQFMQFEKKEAGQNREVTGRWSWLVPPLSPATTPIFHSSYQDREIDPNYYYQEAPYED